MSNQRPPGGHQGPTQDPARPRQQAGGDPGRERGDTSSPTNPPPPRPPEPWADQDRTQAYTPRRRSIVERLDRPDPDPNSAEPSETQTPSPPQAQRPPGSFPPRPPGSAQAGARAARRPLMGQAREGKRGLRLVAILAGVVLLGLVAGAAAAWVSGWRPSFLGSKGETPSGPGTDKPPGETPQTKPGDPKPGEPAAPPGGEIARTCYTNITEIKTGASACGFALDAAGTVTFKGAVIAERLAAGSGAAQRLMLYPFAPSGRYVFLRVCESASGGRCAVQRLADTKEGKMFEVKAAADGFAWVLWSPKEQVGLLGYRDGATDNVAAIATADGRTLKAAAIAPGKNRYALVKYGTMRWTGEESFSVEIKQCPFKRGRARNKECEDDDDVRYRRRAVKFAQ